MWQHHDENLIKLKKIYSKISKQTKNRLQEIFKVLNLNYDNIYNIADKKTKSMIDVKIVEWKDKKLLKGYFGALASNIYNRTRVKNSEILELLIYSAYIEEQNKLDEYENQIIYDDMNYYYTKGQEEVNKSLPKNKRKEILTLTDILFLSLLAMNDSSGYNFNTYSQIVIKNNTDKLYRQAIININQQKELDINDVEFQNIIDRQVDNKIKINGDKIYGSIDHKLIELNNKAKIEGIKLLDKNAKVRFISDNCDNVTPMCKYMNGMIFSINDYNEFTRYIGSSIKDIRQEKIKVFGLVQGVNLPPITSFFHWCHSTIRYVKISTLKEEDDIINPGYKIRSNNSKEATKREIDAIISAVNTINSNSVKTLLKDTQFIIIKKGETDKDYSRYDRNKDKCYIYENADKYEVIHEIGHIIETKLNILNDSKYISIRSRGFDLNNDIYRIDYLKGYDNQYKGIKKGKFVSEYQGLLYNKDLEGNSRIFDCKINLNCLGEYFSEGFREYFENKSNLLKKDKELYEYIEEVLKG